MTLRKFIPFVAFLLLPGLLAAQASIVVSNANATGPGTLNQAILDIPNGGLITFDAMLAGQEIELNDMTDDIQHRFTIDGEDHDITITLDMCGGHLHGFFNP